MCGPKDLDLRIMSFILGSLYLFLTYVDGNKSLLFHSFLISKVESIYISVLVGDELMCGSGLVLSTDFDLKSERERERKRERCHVIMQGNSNKRIRNTREQVRDKLKKVLVEKLQQKQEKNQLKILPSKSSLSVLFSCFFLVFL